MGIKKSAAIFVGRLPAGLQRQINKTLIETRLARFKMKAMCRGRSMPDPANIYWISPKRIAYHTNFLEDETEVGLPISDRSFHDEKLRGKIVGGSWDLTDYRFTDLDVYKAFKARIIDHARWQDTEFYSYVLKEIESGNFIWNLMNREDLDRRCKYLDWLCENIRSKGYTLNRKNYDQNTAFDEIEVNIGRNGDYLFQSSRHRLSISLLLGLEKVPVMVFVRHKKWWEFREFVTSYARKLPTGGRLPQPLVHPDLADIPFDTNVYDFQDLMTRIAQFLVKKNGVMLDIGSNLGFFCHKFEDLGYSCYAVEADPEAFYILEKTRIAEKKKFEAINRPVFEIDLVKSLKCDVVLALDTRHEYLKSKAEYLQLAEFLKCLRTDMLIFRSHSFQDGQMIGARRSRDNAEFLSFISQHASLSKTKIIYTDRGGRHVYLLSK